MKPAANISLLWQELPYLDRFNAAARAGFKGVEVLFPYDEPLAETKAACAANGLELVLINAPPRASEGQPRGFAAVPDLVDTFRKDMARAFRYAEALDARFVHVMAGNAQGDEAFDTFYRNLIWAAKSAPDGLTLTIEPLNPVAMPGYFLNDYALAERVLDAVSMDNVGLQYDSYHAAMIHGDAIETFNAYCADIVHVQIGDSPDRGTPGSGDIDFAALFAAMAGAGYDGWISGEYNPDPKTEDSLNWMKML
ncbi:hydroxypyruvate isomerase family protein [Sulfitobacter sp. CW3]|uniref:hydroxypyruvate isomerase family protein n=1 Tax=Sulfitobacter sp. CW3 TaxID=2861965 RepID=UPI001C5E0E58|nr:TIM barrel protein [Sulfitobacter sp. CW3]MBW4962675.1 TIM barrel protein [Sulfitobacter sp. CW3]